MLETLGGRGLLLVRDSADSEGRSLLRAIVSEAVNRAEQVLVVLLEVPREQFQEGLSPHVRERLHFRDLFGDPLGWGRGRDPAERGGLLGELLGAWPDLGPAPTLVLDSLSWALLREPLPHLCRHLGALLTRGGPRNGDPHPPPRRLLGGAPPARPLPKLGGPQKAPKCPKCGGQDPPDLSPGAVGGRAGGEGGPDPPIPAQGRARGAPRGSRGPRRGPGAVTPPGTPKFGGKIPKNGTPIKELPLPHPALLIWGKIPKLPIMSA
ncbi:elongator complex protein 5-like isoform X3 [Zonotrichia leucophrys gambelii]|uniref:elongator complex protein 5-like isoform X3 n=1 Tax=Zonotrichia leucophrys gambelii TaxID=257770 RepID=UPI0031409113